MAAPGPRRSTRHRVVPDRLIEQNFIGSRRAAPSPWIRKRTIAKEACERARVECRGGVLPGAPPGAAPIPPKPEAKYYCEWISKACGYLLAAIKAFQHAGIVPGSRNEYWPHAQALGGVPVVGYLLRDPDAMDEVTEAWEAAFDAIWTLLGLNPPIAPVLVIPPVARPNRLVSIRNCCRAGRCLTELIRGERRHWLGLEAYSNLRKHQAALARLMAHPENFDYILDPATKTESAVALAVLQGLEDTLTTTEAANAAGVTVFLHTKPFQDHYGSTWVQTLLPGGVPQPVPIPDFPPTSPIEKAILGLTVALHQLAGHSFAYTRCRSAATAVDYPTRAARMGLGTRLGTTTGYFAGGNLMADVTGETGGVAADSVGAALHLP